MGYGAWTPATDPVFAPTIMPSIPAKTVPRTLWLAEPQRSRHQLVVRYGLDDLCFSTTYWYGDVDLPALEERYGRGAMERLYFHITAFEANKLVSLRPDFLDPGPFAPLAGPAFFELWRAIAHNVWGQWRYEHDDPDYPGPELVAGSPTTTTTTTTATTITGPIVLEPGSVETLSFCGGGKDSLVAARLLERAGIPFDSLAYSSSVYGQAAPQHQLIDGLLDHTAVSTRRRMWIFDDFLDSPVTRLHPELGIRHLLAAETPASVFAALPLALAHGYQHLVVAHEHSADFGNLVWSRTGEEVNHQWGKSLAAEHLLADYVERQLVSGVDYFSLLKPIDDTLIFNLLAGDTAGVRATHSCNLRKPWCCRCPKCAYVWLGYMAFLPMEEVAPIFGENLLELDENQLTFRQMLGLEDHTPFECIGTVGETRLAFALCHHKGLAGRAMETYLAEVHGRADFDVETQLDATLAIHPEHRIPSDLYPAIERLFRQGADAARQRIRRLLAGPPAESPC